MKRASVFTIALLLLVFPAFVADINEALGKDPVYCKELLALINQYRSEHKLKPLIGDAKLTTLADSHSADMRRSGSLSHDRFEVRYAKSGRSSCVENVGWNYKTPREQFLGWKRSDGHNANMLDRTIRKAGVAVSGSYVTFFACN